MTSRSIISSLCQQDGCETIGHRNFRNESMKEIKDCKFRILASKVFLFG